MRWKNATFALLTCGMASLATVVAACSDDEPSKAAASSDGASPQPATPEAGTIPDAAPPDAPPASPTSSVVVAFDPQKYELPEALSYRDGFAYVSFAPRAEIEKVSLSGARSTYAKLPIAASSFTLGSAFDAKGDLYVGAAPEGVFKVSPRAGGGTDVALFASSSEQGRFKFANALSFAPDGQLFVADAGEGAIYRIGPGGAVGGVTPWKSDAALAGDLGACPGTTAAFPIGANGIFAEGDAVWVANTDRGTILRIAIEADGRAGAITTVAADCALLEGTDGLRPDPRDPSGAFLVTNNRTNAILSVTRAGKVAVVASGPPYYGPADLAHVGGKGPAELLVVSSSFAEAFAPPDAGLVAKPALVKLTLP